MFCKPKARCFKGISILTGIYALACAGMLMIIPPVIEAHGYTSGSKVDTNVHNMKLASLILLAIFAALAVINLIIFKVY